MDIQNYIKNIFQIKTDDEFNDLSIKLFNYQYLNNKIYNKYINLLGFDTKNIKTYTEIPFIPIELFRSKKIISKNKPHEIVFYSSGTTSVEKSKHYVLDLQIYRESIIRGFNFFWGDPKEFVFLALTPSFEDAKSSSLSFMCSHLIEHTKRAESNFYLKQLDKLNSVILKCQKRKQKFILFGLSFEILNFAKKYNTSLDCGIVIETGGTKKNQEHIIKQDLHDQLKHQFNTKYIFSEYGMAELLSQSYYNHRRKFQSPPWKKILIRDKKNPLKIIHTNDRGGINIIDLANIYSCGFIATNDFGYLSKNGFNIIGRMENSIQRGCDLMI